MNAFVLALAFAVGPTDVEDARLPRSLAESIVEPVRPPEKEERELWLGGHLGVAGAYDGDSPCFVIGFEGRMQILPWLAADVSIDFQTKQEIDKVPGADFFQIPFMFTGLAYLPLELEKLRPYGLIGFGFTITDVSGPSVHDNTDLNLLFFLGFGAEYQLSPNVILDANVRFVFASDPPDTGDFSADWAQFTVGILSRWQNNLMGKNPDVLVIGGGIVGSAIAWRLAKDGLSVTLLEKGEIGRESSWAAGGMLTPVHLADYPPALVDVCAASLALYEPLCREIAGASGVDPEYRVTGLLLLVTDDAGEEAARDLELWKRQHHQPVERLTRDEALAAEPKLTPHLRRALRLPDIAQIRNNRMAVALAEGAKRKGAEILPNTPVTGFLRVPGRVNGVKTPRGDVYAGTTVLAAGAWSAELLKPLGLDLKVKPIKGQILLAGGPPDFCRHMILDGESYLIPRADGRILVGSTLEDVGFDKSVILETLGDLAVRGARLMPELGKLPMVTSWAGLRPATPDRLPYLGKGPLDGLIVATGHYRNGILLAPITAELVADLLAGQAPSIDLSPFDPLRVPQVLESAG